MPTPPDGSVRVSEQRLSELAGIQAPLRQNWATKGRLHRRGRDGYDEADAIELVVLKALMDSLGALDGPIAWADARDQVNRRVDDPNLVLIFDVQDKQASVVSDMEALRDAAPYGHRVLVIDLADPICRVRISFGRVTADL
jgi:hypothetical protein